jgi:hypothetical protein
MYSRPFHGFQEIFYEYASVHNPGKYRLFGVLRVGFSGTFGVWGMPGVLYWDKIFPGCFLSSLYGLG